MFNTTKTLVRRQTSLQNILTVSKFNLHNISPENITNMATIQNAITVTWERKKLDDDVCVMGEFIYYNTHKTGIFQSKQ